MPQYLENEICKFTPLFEIDYSKKNKHHFDRFIQNEKLWIQAIPQICKWGSAFIQFHA